ncbi:LysR family transcriptional regulator [Sporosarcina sp. FSL W7-1349]|uniref:LysR family transcriptional regulator n=1 Tax=Sporosarcina sp. FSL W7-1349 TaxID=2921561 RepID=UPI0030F5D10E
MEMKWLKTFCVAAKYENFRQASEELFLTQPAITKHIQRLEVHLNQPLFERIGKSVVLTAAGHRFLPIATNIVTTYEQGIEDFEAWKQGYKRKLMIATAPQIASSVLPPIMRRFMDENPDIELIINVLNSYEIGEEISVGRADLGLTRIRPVQSNIDCRIVHEEPVLLVAPPDERNGTPVDEETVLATYRVITHNHPDYWDRLLPEIKRHYPNVRTMKVNQIEITKRFIEQGLGISYVPYTMVKEEVRTNRLTEIKPNKIIPPHSTTYVLTKVMTEEADAFLVFLEEEIKKAGRTPAQP